MEIPEEPVDTMCYRLFGGKLYFHHGPVYVSVCVFTSIPSLIGQMWDISAGLRERHHVDKWILSELP